MRTVVFGIAALLLTGLAANAQAERRMFIIANDADGYGVDRCLANGERCGAAAANAYCKTHQFAEAANYRRVDREEITGAISTGDGGACTGAKCDNLVAIICSR